MYKHATAATDITSTANVEEFQTKMNPGKCSPHVAVKL